MSKKILNRANTLGLHFVIGARVRIFGINSKPHYNNTLGIIEDVRPSGKEGWRVRCDVDGKLQELKEANLDVEEMP